MTCYGGRWHIQASKRIWCLTWRWYFKSRAPKCRCPLIPVSLSEPQDLWGEPYDAGCAQLLQRWETHTPGYAVAHGVVAANAKCTALHFTVMTAHAQDHVFLQQRLQGDLRDTQGQFNMKLAAGTRHHRLPNGQDFPYRGRMWDPSAAPVSLAVTILAV